MIIVTGAAGFIGYNMVQMLNKYKFNDIIAVDRFIRKKHSLTNCKIKQSISWNKLADWIDQNYTHCEFIIHLGARTDTTEYNIDLLWELNTDYTKMLWSKCVEYQIPLIYASSAATYGLGELGFKDDESQMSQLKPLNPYGESKLAFDLWAYEQEEKPFYWCGLKFFNVYGPGEENKLRMASVVWHAYNQIKSTKKMKLFRSHNQNYKDGKQMRDFIFVKDVVEVIYWLMHHRRNSGIYNLGTGKARTFLDLAKSIFSTMRVAENISFIDTPEDIRDKYQYFTEADMEKLTSIGYEKRFTSLEEGVNEYINLL